jgi:hypothetical protein
MPEWNGNFSQSDQAYLFGYIAENEASVSINRWNMPSEITFS